MSKCELILCGAGNVGGAFIRQVLAARDSHQNNFGIRLVFKAIFDSSGYVTHPNSNSSNNNNNNNNNDDNDSKIDDDAKWVQEALQYKLEGKKFKDADNGQAGSLSDFLSSSSSSSPSSPSSPSSTSSSMTRTIVVDSTSADDLTDLLIQVLEQDGGIVLANKKPITDTFQKYSIINSIKHQNRVRIESTVGAGTPVNACMARLVRAADSVSKVQGSFSGTLGYLMTELQNGTKFSEAVKKAKSLGYTEPDPRDDLSGTDVARKALILARQLGFELEMKDLDIKPLYPTHLGDKTISDFMDSLHSLDEEYEKRCHEAKTEGKVLRYLASISAEGQVQCRVGLEAVPESTPLGQLQGTANMCAFSSKWFGTDPLVVMGSGAGADITAAGMLADCIEIVQAAW